MEQDGCGEGRRPIGMRKTGSETNEAILVDGSWVFVVASQQSSLVLADEESSCRSVGVASGGPFVGMQEVPTWR